MSSSPKPRLPQSIECSAIGPTPSLPYNPDSQGSARSLRIPPTKRLGTVSGLMRGVHLQSLLGLVAGVVLFPTPKEVNGAATPSDFSKKSPITSIATDIGSTTVCPLICALGPDLFDNADLYISLLSHHANALKWVNYYEILKRTLTYIQVADSLHWLWTFLSNHADSHSASLAVGSILLVVVMGFVPWRKAKDKSDRKAIHRKLPVGKNTKETNCKATDISIQVDLPGVKLRWRRVIFSAT